MQKQQLLGTFRNYSAVLYCCIFSAFAVFKMVLA